MYLFLYFSECSPNQLVEIVMGIIKEIIDVVKINCIKIIFDNNFLKFKSSIKIKHENNIREKT